MKWMTFILMNLFELFSIMNSKLRENRLIYTSVIWCYLCNCFIKLGDIDFTRDFRLQWLVSPVEKQNLLIRSTEAVYGSPQQSPTITVKLTTTLYSKFQGVTPLTSGNQNERDPTSAHRLHLPWQIKIKENVIVCSPACTIGHHLLSSTPS